MDTTYARLTSAGSIELRTRQLEPAPDEAVVRVAACGICRGDVRHFQSAAKPVDRFGHEPVGQVVAIGERVGGVHEGDWVAGTIHGSFATHVVAKESELHRVPAELGEMGCLAEPLKCVTTAARAAAPDFEDTVVVVGCGFMGLAAVAALAKGWHRELIAIDPAPERRMKAVPLGATYVLNPDACDVRDEVFARTKGSGADAAVEFAGSATAATLAANMLRPRGRLVLAGGETPDENVYARAITIHHAAPAFSLDDADDYRRAIDAMSRGLFPLDALVSHRFKLSELQHAIETASAGEDGYLKGIVVNDLA